MSKSFFPTVPKPPTALAQYRQLSPLAGIYVSPIQLGAMSIGDKWDQFGLGSMDKESSMKLLDTYYDAGGNFIDTANAYQDGSSEEFLGEWMENRRIRDRLVIATKFTANWRMHDDDMNHTVLFQGNTAKALHISLEQSLKRLRTSYIDILYVHWWDFSTSIDEVMNHLHNAVVSGKVLYLGVSDTPAWVVAQCNQYARDHGKTPFCIYQGQWNVMERSFERDIIPLAIKEGMALAPWQVLAGGKLRTDEEDEKRRKTGEKGRTTFGDWERTEDEKKMSHALEEIAKEDEAHYRRHKAPFVFPIIGGRKAEHLYANLEALNITLTSEHIKQLESVIPFSPGFPHNMIGDGTSPSYLMTLAAHIQWKPQLQALKPASSA